MKGFHCLRPFVKIRVCSPVWEPHYRKSRKVIPLAILYPLRKLHVHLYTDFDTAMFVQIRVHSRLPLIERIIFICDMSIVTRHPSGVRLEIVGINESNRGRSCEQHRCCGRIVTLDMVLRLRKVQIMNGKA